MTAFHDLGKVSNLDRVVGAVGKAHVKHDHTPIGYTLGVRDLLVLPAHTFSTEKSVRDNSVSRKVAQRMNPGKPGKNPYRIGDRVKDKSGRSGRVTFLGEYDSLAKAWRIKVEDKSGAQKWWNANSDVSKDKVRKTNPAPGRMERSEKLHKIRAQLWEAFKKEKDETKSLTLSRKVRQVDRMLAAPGKHERAAMEGRKVNPPDMKKRNDKLYAMAQRAEAGFTAALKRMYPRRKHLGDVRYNTGGFNAETKAAHAKMLKAMGMLQKHWDKVRGKK